MIVILVAGDGLCVHLTRGRAEDRPPQPADHQGAQSVQAGGARRELRFARHAVQDAHPGDAGPQGWVFFLFL